MSASVGLRAGERVWRSVGALAHMPVRTCGDEYTHGDQAASEQVGN